MRYQGVCLESVSGCETMGYYDAFPPEVRLLLRSSTENLCPACLPRFARFYDTHELILAVGLMEREIRLKRNGWEPAF